MPDVSRFKYHIKRVRLRRVAIAGVIALILLEAGLRVYGVGSPALVVRDPDAEYYPRPSSSYSRRFNSIQINSFGMRGPEMSREKSSANVYRLLAIGDSVLNGGSGVDQKSIATELARAPIAECLKRPVEILNISWGGWGPGNMLGYIRKFGTFGADDAILYLNYSGSVHDRCCFAQFRQVPTLIALDFVCNFSDCGVPQHQS